MVELDWTTSLEKDAWQFSMAGRGFCCWENIVNMFRRIGSRGWFIEAIFACGTVYNYLLFEIV